MIDKNQLQDLYNQGTISFNAEQLNNVPIGNTVKTFLAANGLPESSRKESTLGIHFITDVNQMTAVSVGKENYWKIGDEWEENTNIIAIKEGTEEVYEIELNSGKATFVNSDLPSFLLLLQYFKQYSKRKEATEPPPMQLSREEMLKKLEMMRNGTLPVA
ncbi:MAG TPA: SUKH-4 family immunity protein, partial [Niastella sp.]